MFLTLESRTRTIRRLSMGIAFSFLVGLATLLGAQPAQAAACASGLTQDPASWTQNPRPISSAQELIYLSEKTKGLNFDPEYVRANYIVVDDINLGNCVFTQIPERASTSGGPTSSTQFFYSGIFDGGDHTISGLNIEASSSQSLFGLFGFVRGGRVSGVDLDGVVKNLHLEGSVSFEWTGSTKNLGSVAGQVADGRIENVHADVNVTLAVPDGHVGELDSPSAVGGLVGYAEGSTITQSSAIGDVSLTFSDFCDLAEFWCSPPAAGGLLGRTFPSSDNNVLVEYSFASGDVTASEGTTIGGLVGVSGERDRPLSYVVVDAYFISGSVTGGKVIGGLLGESQAQDGNASVDRVYSAAGALTGPGTSTRGGLVGVLGSQHISDESFFDQDIINLSSSAGGLGRTTQQMKSIDTFRDAGWSIVNGWAPFDPDGGKVWGICSGLTDTGGYPFLLWEYTRDQAVAAGCPVPSGPSEPSTSSAPLEKRADAPAIHLDLQVAVGQQISGAPVVIGGQGLAGGSAYTLTVRSTPQVIEQGTASALGNFSKQVSMPPLSAGSHTLTLSAVAPNGSVLTLVQGFTIGSDGTVTALGTPAGSSGSALAATGSDSLVMLRGVGVAMLMMVLGASALAATRARKNLPV
jgi:hypothetical protein